jgi:predicted phosphoribosyltransferase
VALPGPANPNDPKELIAAQSNLTEVFKSGKVATPQERNLALGAVAQGARQLHSDGYSKSAAILQAWLKDQGYRAP